MVRRVKKKYQWFAELAVDVGVVGEMDHDAMVGMWLNRHDCMRRRAATVALGVSAMLSQNAANVLQDAAG